MTQTGFEPSNFRLVALCLNKMRHRVPQNFQVIKFFQTIFDKMPPSRGARCAKALYNNFWKIRVSQEWPSLLIMSHSNNFVFRFVEGVLL
jgi:hypothetical protein